LFDNTLYPIVVENVPITTATDHNISMYLLLNPETFMSFVEASPSGRFETKIATKKAIFIAPPVASVIPSAAFSGILSITEPMNNALPEAGLLSFAILSSGVFSVMFVDAFFDFFSRTALDIVYESPPKIKPIIVASSV